MSKIIIAIAFTVLAQRPRIPYGPVPLPDGGSAPPLGDAIGIFLLMLLLVALVFAGVWLPFLILRFAGDFIEHRRYLNDKRRSEKWKRESDRLRERELPFHPLIEKRLQTLMAEKFPNATRRSLALLRRAIGDLSISPNDTIQPFDEKEVGFLVDYFQGPEPGGLVGVHVTYRQLRIAGAEVRLDHYV